LKTNPFKHYDNSNCYLQMTKTEITRTVMAVSGRNQRETVTFTEKNIIEITWGKATIHLKEEV